MITLTARYADIEPVLTCECGVESRGDSWNDAWAAWWVHVRKAHPGKP